MIDDISDKSEPPRRCGPGEVETVIPASEDDPPPEPGPRRPTARQSLSQRLTALAQDPARERIAMSDLLDLMPGQALAALILIFAAPNVVPAPPGLSAILGWPLIYLSWQQMTAQRPWLPPVIARRSISRTVFAGLMRRVTPVLAALERMLRPRLATLVTPRAEQVVGAFCLVLSVVLLLPVPLGNMPPALAISVMMLGLLERDGLWTGIGVVLGIASFIIAVGVVYAMIKAVIFLLSQALV
ncbi:exopolysaccharide biosynthesis protein [Paracoccus aestuariivivens]|uniref:Exopolysaccharide biosynthesis protein n=1 Tax=Paracoccus aestuariivivens TaxID=1820333 RepID=A0A6L6J6G8_9RHOB|nr:exopolysaccharide biosynthesis protein [Paracoccus aestuariivivens]MTH77713.1 exopolysaccharide biosynthesis protein [Paracoccus aestuariivivens]